MKHKETKKKPGEFQKKKEFYQRRQIIFNAVKKARDEGSATLTYQGVEYEVIPPEDDRFCYPMEVLYTRGNLVHKGLYVEKDGHHIIPDNPHYEARHSFDRILTGLVPLHQYTA